MLTIFLLLVVAVSCLVALVNWRWGVLFCIVVGLLQDPVRKVTPGTPAYLTLAFLPICFAMLGTLWSSTDLMGTVRRHFPELIGAGLVFAVALTASTIQTLSYGLHALPLALLGLFSYAGSIPALFLGFFFLRRNFDELDWPLVGVTGLASLMLVGVPLEYFGVKFSDPWLGTIAMSGVWRRWYGSTGWVEMISGFYRSPEIMGWHAATLVILAMYLLIRKPAVLPLWGACAGWGLSCALLSGRRKMLFLVVIFLLVFALFARGGQTRKLLFCLAGAALLALPILSLLVGDRYLETAQSSLDAVGDRAANTAVSGPLWLLGVVGLFGYGVGTKTQGGQHLGIDLDIPSFEGGFEKVLIELGVVGTAVLILLLIVFVRATLLCFRRIRMARLDATGPTALGAFVIANAAVFIVAFQIYGDPFVVFLVGFAGGLLLSGSRLAEQRLQTAAKHRLLPPSTALP